MSELSRFDPFGMETLFALIAALAFTALALASVVRRSMFGQRAYVVALAATAIWLFVLTIAGSAHVASTLAEAARNLAWLWFMAAVAGEREAPGRIGPVGWIYIGLCALEAALGLLVAMTSTKVLAPSVAHMLHILQMLFAAGALVLVHNLVESGRPEERRGLALPLGALTGLWAYDLNLYAIAYLSGQPAELLETLRPLAAVLIAAALAIAVVRPVNQSIRLSRPVALRSLGLAAIGGWLALLALFAAIVDSAGGDFSSRAQVGVLAAAITAMALLFLSPRLRALVRVWTVKHFFEHRYDYRAEWLRFTATLHRPEDGRLSLPARVIKSIADMVEAHGGLLIGRDAAGHFVLAAEWPSGAMTWRADAQWDRFAAWLGSSGRIVQFDEVRAGKAPEEEVASTPDWVIADRDHWIAVPLDNQGELEGFLLLSRPLIDRALDWEDFDLLKVAGRQAASHLAEARRSEALAESGRFEEFHRRFAFMMHDVKNLASQMGVLARNAERHGDNPEFRVDMIETLKLSAERLSQLMQRLSQQDQVRVSRLEPVDIAAVARRVAHVKNALHPVEVLVEGEGRASGESETVEQLLVHLVQNAIDASDPQHPVRLHVVARADAVTVDIEDRGVGMSPEFVRNHLFRPFSSTKAGGFGIGAYQARRLAEAMGGSLTVESREGQGTRFTLTLRPADRPAQISNSISSEAA
jgi:putative PEP-CTERM system histidine kinase